MHYDKSLTLHEFDRRRYQIMTDRIFDRKMPLKLALMGKSSQWRINVET